MLLFLYYVIPKRRGFYLWYVVVQEVAEWLVQRLFADWLYFFSFAHILNLNIVILINILQNHLVLAQISIKYRFLLFFVEIVVKGDYLRLVLRLLPLVFNFHFVSHANLPSPCAEAVIFVHLSLWVQHFNHRLRKCFISIILFIFNASKVLCKVGGS